MKSDTALNILAYIGIALIATYLIVLTVKLW